MAAKMTWYSGYEQLLQEKRQSSRNRTKRKYYSILLHKPTQYHGHDSIICKALGVLCALYAARQERLKVKITSIILCLSINH
jgi:hypothetical protein